VDGGLVNTTEQNSGITDLKWTPSVDAVQEFKMQTNFFGAEYARLGFGSKSHARRRSCERLSPNRAFGLRQKHFRQPRRHKSSDAGIVLA